MDSLLKIHRKIIKGEDGFILVLGIAMLVVLTLIGLSGTRTSTVDLKIAGNERKIAQDFYVADSTWQVGALWLKQKANPPDLVNITPRDKKEEIDPDIEYYAIVRNYGEGGNGYLNDTFPDDTEDGAYDPSDDNVDNGTIFWYRGIYNGDTSADEFGEGYRDFHMGIQANANRTTTVSTRIFKVFRVGYN